MKKKTPFPYLGFPADYLLFDFAALLDFENARGASVMDIMASQAFDVRFVAAALPAGLKRCWQEAGRYNPVTYTAEVMQLLDEHTNAQADYLRINAALLEAILASGIMTRAGGEGAADDGAEKKPAPSTASAPSLKRRS